ncbi:hypothetical protein D3C78_1779210 [compost metagenome]
MEHLNVVCRHPAGEHCRRRDFHADRRHCHYAGRHRYRYAERRRRCHVEHYGHHQPDGH